MSEMILSIIIICLCLVILYQTEQLITLWKSKKANEPVNLSQYGQHVILYDILDAEKRSEEGNRAPSRLDDLEARLRALESWKAETLIKLRKLSDLAGAIRKSMRRYIEKAIRDYVNREKK